MCGIVGYIGPKTGQDIIYKGLSRLEYRGYDSSGIAVQYEDQKKFRTVTVKAPGKLKELKKFWSEISAPGFVAIGHTRWATHGEANQRNAHPHRSGPITIVHNGIIENHQDIRSSLRKQGVEFSSDTDTELFGHLVHLQRKAGVSLVDAVRLSFQQLHGSSAFVVIDDTTPNTIVVARNGSPLVIGKGTGENFVASDVPAVLEYTKEFYYLADQEIAEISAEKIRVWSIDGKEKTPKFTTITWAVDAIDKQGFDHYMLKEIHEQPRALSDTLNPWLDLAKGKFRLDNVTVAIDSSGASQSLPSDQVVELFSQATMIQIVACGTAAYAGFFGQQLLERAAKIPVRAELASEFRYREPMLRSTDVGLVVSQSGETADTLAAIKLMKQAGMKVFAICNVRGSSIARECAGVFYTNAGIEVGVASTKAFITQMALFAVIAGALAARRKLLTEAQERTWVESLGKLPSAAEEMLKNCAKMPALAERFKDKKCFLYLGRGGFYSIALEGALKLKEIAYSHAEGFAAGELKHGPIAMVEPGMLSIAISPDRNSVIHEKSLSNFAEVRARKGKLWSICAEDDELLKGVSDDYLICPPLPLGDLLPIVAVIPLQLFAYHMAVLKGTDVDQPRNLAKSVTVE